MKAFRNLAFMALIFSLVACATNQEKATAETNSKTEAAATTPAPTSTKNRIEVMEFYSTHRCATCNDIEANTKYTLNTYFSKELKDGTITYQSLNVDEEPNVPVAEKFEAAGTALFLNVVVDNNETQIDLTDFAFMKGRNQKEFSDELKSKIEAQLKNL